MTVIIGAILQDGREVLVSDGRTSLGGSTILTNTSIKINQLPKASFGLAGTTFHQALFRKAIKGLKKPGKDALYFALSDAFQGKFDGEGLVFHEHNLYFLSSDLYPNLVTPFFAAGSGGEAATAYLMGTCGRGNRPTEEQIRRAYDVALELDSGCGGPIQFFVLNQSTTPRQPKSKAKRLLRGGKRKQKARAGTKARTSRRR